MMRIVVLNLFLLSSLMMHAQQPALMDIVSEELERELKAFEKIDHPPYYIDYRISDYSIHSINASFGSIVTAQSVDSRFLTTQVRVGSYELDHSHSLRGERFSLNSARYSISQLPVENNKDAIQHLIWLQTDAQYKASLKLYKKVINQPKEVLEQQKTLDFSKEAPNVSIEADDMDQNLDIVAWEILLSEVSARFKKNPSIIEGKADLGVTFERRYFINSEGSKIVQNFPRADLRLIASIRSDNGDRMTDFQSFKVNDLENLPSREELIKTADQMMVKLVALKRAAKAEPYSGPAIFSPRATGVFFHEIFGHRVEGHRLKKEFDSQTFKEKLDEKVLPKFIHVYSDPTLTSFEGTDLTGHYRFDDQGVIAQRVTLVQDGVLKTFLADRSPLFEGHQSNGHGRAQDGVSPVSRQSNLIVESSKKVTDAQLRKMLKKECSRQKREYGYYFKDVQGGFTTTDRSLPNAFKIMPIEVYKIYVDGRPDELVSGVDMIGTPLTMFSEIVATGEEMGVFNGYCGAESGNVPVSAVAPAIFVKKIETQKKPQAKVGLPILNNPETDPTIKP